MEIILASSSPRRKSLLEQVGISFEIKIPEVDENNVFGTPEQVVCILSKRKSKAVSGDVVIAADTVVAVDSVILNKPKDKFDAFEMLKKLSGRSHFVYTGISVRCGEKINTCACTTEVFFKELSETEILEYINTGEPMDKAGAYAIQGRAAVFVEKINGDYNNVVGLSVATLYEMLKTIGVKI